MIAISENLDDEAQERLCKSDQKRKQTMPKNLDDEAKQKIYKADKKKKQFEKILMMKPKKNCVQ